MLVYARRFPPAAVATQVNPDVQGRPLRDNSHVGARRGGSRGARSVVEFVCPAEGVRAANIRVQLASLSLFFSSLTYYHR